MNGVLDCKFVGYSSFNSKDKLKTLYLIQCLYTEVNKSQFKVSSRIIDVFVTEEEYNTIIDTYEGLSDIQIKYNINIGTGKIFYSING